MAVEITMPPGETQQEPETPQVPQRPEHVPEKFWNAEKGEINVDALLKAQRDAEAELHRLQQQRQQSQAQPAQAQQQAAQEPPQQTQDGAPTIAELRQRATQEYLQNGSLSDDTYAAFEAAGVDRDTVDAAIEGARARQTAQQEKLFRAAEVTREQFQQASEWARNNLSQEEIAELNEELRDPITAAAAIRKLHSRFTQEANVDGSLETGNAPGASVSGEYYKNMDEMMAVVNSDLYKKGDPATHKAHLQKMVNSEKLGINLFMRGPGS